MAMPITIPTISAIPVGPPLKLRTISMLEPTSPMPKLIHIRLHAR